MPLIFVLIRNHGKHISIMDITFLRSLFSLGSACNSIDLSKAALPEDDVRVRVGNYNLLYDKVDKEWSLWMKS